MKRISIVILLMAMLAGLSLPSVSAPAPLTFARIAAWNQQGVRFVGDDVIPINKPAQLRAAISAINPEVIALSEVNSRASLDEIVATPFANGATYKVNMENGQSGQQMIAVLFKDSPEVSVGNRRAISGSDDGNPDLRKAFAFDVKIRNFDFLLIAVHLKSARGNAERLTRTRQARAIATFIRNATSTTDERDVLVVGDYNMIPGPDAANFSSLSPGPGSNEFLKFISSSLGGPSHIGSCTSGGNFNGNLLDGFAISRAHTTEWTGFIRIQQLQTQLPSMSCSKYKTTVSDHLPLVARFRVSNADDD